MRVESIQISRYRSLYDVVFSPGDFTVLVGPNNSGKSNFIDAVDFIAEAYRYGLDVAIGRKGGFENIAHRKMRRTKSPLVFGIVSTMPTRELAREGLVPGVRRLREDAFGDEIRIAHNFQLVARSQAIEADYRVSSESLSIERRDSRGGVEELLSVHRQNDDVQVRVNEGLTDKGPLQQLVYPFDDAGFQKYLTSAGSPPSELLLGARIFNPVLSHFARAIANTRVYQLAPLEGRRPGVPTPNPDLDRHGANLPAFVAQLRKNPTVWAEILETMRRVVPGLQDIDTDFTPDRRLSLRFHESNVGRPWASEDVSDGTVQSLALLAALHDPRTEFLLIEEPENAVHPWIVRSFVEASRSVKNKQIVLTTHSPVLIDTLAPSEVRVVWRSRGETHISPLLDLDPDAQGLWNQGTAKVFEMLDTGWLPEAVPGARE